MKPKAHALLLMMTASTRSKYALLLILLVAALWRGWLIAGGGVRFDSDEAIIGLMARHILQGEPIPTFYYGQSYMGSLDALLTAGGFALGGASVQTMRIVQAVLYLLSILAGYALALEVTRQYKTALITALLLAVPNMLGVLYTTITLGGYNEIILLGSLVLLLGWQLTINNLGGAWRWALLGFLAGVGWWVNGAIITPILVVGILGLRYFSLANWRFYLLAGAAFLIGGAPWWVYNLRHDWGALDFLLNQQPTPGTETLSLLEKLAALVAIGFSGLYGLRFPWQASLQTGAAALLVGGVYLLLASDFIARRPRSAADAWVWLVVGVMATVFLLSSFQDPTGRYLMPLWIPTTVGLALGIRRLGRFLGPVALGILLAFHCTSTLKATHSPDGISGQLAAHLRTPPQDSEALIHFLTQNGYTYGYTSYWVSYRTAFLTQEALLFDTRLPYDENGYRPNNNRYPPYVEAVAAADASQIAVITHNLPLLDAVLAREWADIPYQTQQIGVYLIYYGFTEHPPISRIIQEPLKNDFE